MGEFAEEEKKKVKTAKPAPPVQRQIVEPQTVEQQTVQRDLSEVNGPEGGMLPDNVSSKIQSMRGGGQRLSDRQNQFYSQKFGRDMSDVHIHTDTQSDTISRSLNARAFTIGSDVFLTKGINPDGGGRDAQTMTHELTHVVQQGGHASSGPLKLGAADTAQEHEAESTAQREYAPDLKNEDDTIQRENASELDDAKNTIRREFVPGQKGAENTIQRGFWSDLGSAFASTALNALGIGDAMGDFLSGDKKVKAAIEKMAAGKRLEYNGIEENIKRDEENNIPNLEKEIKGYQKRLSKLEGDPNMVDECDRIQEELEGAQMALDGRKQDLDNELKAQLAMLQAVDATITTEDVNRYRSGKAKTFFSSVFASIGGNILGSFENDPEKKAAARAKGRNSINNWFASANKTSLEGETEEQKAAKAEAIEQRQKSLVDSIWNDVERDQVLSRKYTKLLFKREIAKNHMTMIQESIKDNESDEDIKSSVMVSLRNNAQSSNAEQPQQG